MQVEAQVDSLVGELAALRMDALASLEGLRADMHAEVRAQG